MRFNKPTVAAGNGISGGYTGIPSWRRKWIENQVRWAILECGCVEDINLPVLTFINAFDGAQIDCVNCGRFVKVIRTIKSKNEPVKTPDEPLF